jgi:MFS family permease
MNEAALPVGLATRLPAKEKVPYSAWYGLFALSVVNIYAIIDRQIFTLLAEPIRIDLGLSDTQLGVLQGVGLTMVGMLTIYPISWLGDRYDRRKISAAVILLWSLAVVGCGFSPNFAWLFLFASLVGIGENARAPVAFAMIPDLFTPGTRALGNSIYVFVSVIAGSLATYLTGLLVSEIDIVRTFLPDSLASLPDWRLALIFAAAFVPVAIALTLSMPARTAGNVATLKDQIAEGEGDAADAPDAVPSESIVSYIKRNRKVLLGFNGAVMVLLFGLAAGTSYLPVIAMRDYQETAGNIASKIAVLALVNAAIGFALANFMIGRLIPRFGGQFPMVALAVAAMLAVFGSILLATASSLNQLYVYYCVLAIMLSVVTMLYPTVIQNLTVPHLRARMFAIISISQLIAAGLGTVAGGVASDVLKTFGVQQSLLIGGNILAAVCSGIAAIMFWRTRDSYLRLTEQIEA